MGKLLILCSIFTAAFSRQLVDEFKAWTPWMIGRLITFAVRRLPKDRRERYYEEWQSHVAEIPGEVGKIFTALSFSFAAFKMNSESRKRAKEEAVSRRRRNQEIVLMALLVGLALNENRTVRNYSLLLLLGIAILVCRAGAWLDLTAQRQAAPLTVDEGVLLVIVCAFAFVAARSLGNKATAMAI
jgi:hypothetical protein